MSEYLIQDSTLTDIADAIRAKDGSSAPILTEDMADAIAAIPTGGGEAYELHSVQITLSASTPIYTILKTYVKECSSWRIYPTDPSNTALSTIAAGTAFRNTDSSQLSPDMMPAAQSATGVNVPSNIGIFYVNDQTYNVVRQRGNVNIKPAGAYQLDFYGVAK